MKKWRRNVWNEEEWKIIVEFINVIRVSTEEEQEDVEQNKMRQRHEIDLNKIRVKRWRRNVWNEGEWKIIVEVINVIRELTEEVDVEYKWRTSGEQDGVMT